MTQPLYASPLYEEPLEKMRMTRILSITSGKGGVGKTTIAINLALDLQERGNHVLLLDADLGLANADLMLGLRSRFSLLDLLDGKCNFDQAVETTPQGIDLLSAGSGLGVRELDDDSRRILMDRLADIDGRYDYVLIDTGAGISDNVLYFNRAAHGAVVVVTPEATSRMNAYSLIRILFLRHSMKRFQVLVNQAACEAEGRNVYRQLAEVIDKHLGDVSLGYLGCLSHDKAVGHAVRMQRAAIEEFPNCAFARELGAVTERLTGLQARALDSGMSLFWRRLFSETPAGEI